MRSNTCLMLVQRKIVLLVLLTIQLFGCNSESDEEDGLTDALDIPLEEIMDVDAPDPIPDVADAEDLPVEEAFDVADLDEEDTLDVAGDQDEESIPPNCEEAFDPLNPDMKVIFFDFSSPANLDSAVLENFIVENIYSESFIWLMQFEGVDDGITDDDGLFHLFTGAGEKVEGFDDCFIFREEPEWAPGGANMNISGDDMSWPEGEPKFDIRLPIFEIDGEILLFELPLREVIIEWGSFSVDRTAIGSPMNCTFTGGRVAGVITVEDAKDVVIDFMGLTLCGLLSGDKGPNPHDPSDDCLLPEETWSDQPDSEVEGRSAYSIGACFSAEQILLPKY